jgi:hypothetical protein
MAALSAEQMYAFDVEGFVVIPAVLADPANP